MGAFDKAKELAGKYAKKGLDKAGDVRAERQGAVAEREGAAAERNGVAAQAAGMSPHHFTHEVVGESHYQQALEKAVGRQKDQDGSYWRGTAEIRHDAKNKHDRWAIVVTIDNRAVGYLPSADSNRVLAGELAGVPRPVPARIMGGFKLDNGGMAYYGVELAL